MLFFVVVSVALTSGKGLALLGHSVQKMLLAMFWWFLLYWLSSTTRYYELRTLFASYYYVKPTMLVCALECTGFACLLTV